MTTGYSLNSESRGTASESRMQNCPDNLQFAVEQIPFSVAGRGLHSVKQVNNISNVSSRNCGDEIWVGGWAREPGMHVFPYDSPHMHSQWQRAHCGRESSLGAEQFIDKWLISERPSYSQPDEHQRHFLILWCHTSLKVTVTCLTIRPKILHKI